MYETPNLRRAYSALEAGGTLHVAAAGNAGYW
jgi:hypothetical protein